MTSKRLPKFTLIARAIAKTDHDGKNCTRSINACRCGLDVKIRRFEMSTARFDWSNSDVANCGSVAVDERIRRSIP